jgi:hypothetical protein
VSFDPYAVLDGRRFLAMLGINEAARCLGLPSLFAHLCQQAIKRGEHLLVVQSDGALLGGRFGIRFVFGVAGGIHGGGRHAAGHLPVRGGLPTGGGDRERHHADARLPADG